MNKNQLKKKKEQQFQLLYETYYAPFCLYAKRFIEDKEVRIDIVSDVFVSLWDKVDEFDLDSKTIVGYLKMCVKNNCLNLLKHQGYEWEYAEQMQNKSPIYETETDSIYTLNELYQMLNDTLDKLPKEYKKVFYESFFQHKTQAEIAAELNISVKSVNRYKQRTLEILRKELKDYFPLILVLLVEY